MTTADHACSALANLVYSQRIWHASAAARLRDRSHHSKVRAGIASARRTYDEVRRQIAEELTASEVSGELELCASFVSIWDRFVAPSARVTVVTTNWDRLLTAFMRTRWPRLREDAVFHVHGDRRDARLLLLPTEVVHEPYRDARVMANLARRKRDLMRAMERASKLVISGLSLSPLDAELTHALAVGLDEGRVEEIVIADPAHDFVAGRLMVLLRQRRPRIVGCDPEHMQAQVEHRWRT